MKKITSLLFVFFLATQLLAQTDSSFIGKWKISVYVGEKHTTQSYLLLNADSTFTTSSDSSFSESAKRTSTGKWKLTSAGDIKLIPSDTTREIHYYKHISDWKFKYDANEKYGVKSPVVLEGVEVYIEKIVYVKKEKKGKKKK